MTTQEHYIIVGCGRVGVGLAHALNAEGASAVVIDPNPRAFDRLSADFRGRTVVGEGIDVDALRRAGIESATGLAAVTTFDSVNFVAARVARDIFKVPRVVARVYNPRRAPLYAKFGLTVVTSSSWGAQRIEQLLRPIPVTSVYDIGDGGVVGYEVTIPERWHGETVSALLPAEGVLPVALLRAGVPSLPSLETRLQTADKLTVSATPAGWTALRHRLEGEV